MLVASLFVSVAQLPGWQGSTQLTNKPSTAPSSFAGRDGNVYVVWSGSASAEGVYYKHYNVSNGTWSADIQIVSGHCEDAKVFVNEGGIVYIAWATSASGTWKIYFKKINTAGIEILPVTEIASINNPSSPDVFVYGGRAYFVWQQSDGVYYRMYNGGWYDDQKLDGPASHPSIKYETKTGLIQISWVSDKYGGNEIFYSYINPNNPKVSDDGDGDGIYDSVERGWSNFTNASYNDADPLTTSNPVSIDTDGDGLPDGWIDGWSYYADGDFWGVNYSMIDGSRQAWKGEDRDCDGKEDSGETNASNPDSDGDGMYDGWEIWYGLDSLNASGDNGSAADPDMDGLTNIVEYGNRTSPLKNDTDNDGLNDYYEILMGSNPFNQDTDGDGLWDGQENFTADVDGDGLPSLLDIDSDNDGVPDGREYYNVTRQWTTWWGKFLTVEAGKRTPFNDTDRDGKINMLDSDSDNDGLSDGAEFANGSKPWRPVMRDSDDDGISDEQESHLPTHFGIRKTSPDNPDSDGDGLWDGEYTKYSFASLADKGELNLDCDPLDYDTDGDGLPDGTEAAGWTVNAVFPFTSYSDPTEPDTDGDGISDYLEYNYHYDASRVDTDRDLLWDDQEDKNANGIIDSDETDPLNPDCDGDGALDGQEFLALTDPYNRDTDGDGLMDSVENHLVEFRTSATDVNNGTEYTETFTGTGPGKGTFEIDYVASGFAEASEDINVQTSRVLSYPSEYTWSPSSNTHATDGRVITSFDLTASEYIVVVYNSQMGGQMTGGAYGPGHDFSGFYSLGSVINVTFHSSQWQTMSMEYVEFASLPNGTIDLNETQYTYLNYIYNGHYKNEIVTGYTFHTNENFTVTYICGPEIDYGHVMNGMTWVAVNMNITSDYLTAMCRTSYWTTDSQIESLALDYEGTTPEGYPVYYNHSAGYFVVDIPGSNNPKYNEVPYNYSFDLYMPDGVIHYQPPMLGRASIFTYAMNNQETYDTLFNFDPSNRDTNNDGLLDGDNRDLVFLYSNHKTDSDYDGIVDWEDNDTDADGIMNGEEPFWNQDIDYDGKINALDNDTDNDAFLDGQEVKVVFRTNRGPYAKYVAAVPWNIEHVNNTYYGADVGVYNSSNPAALDEYFCSGHYVSYNPATLSLSRVNYSFIGTQTPVETPEGYYVYKDRSNASRLYIDIDDGYGDSFVPLHNGTSLVLCNKVNFNLIDLGRSLNSAYASRHRETYDGTLAVTTGSIDNDGDGLHTDADGNAADDDPNDNNPDIDNDGLADGIERRWNNDTDGDGRTNINDVDSDNDGLSDGWIDGWGYNATKAAAHQHAVGTIDGYGIWNTADGVRQAWEGEDINTNGMRDVNETDVLWADSDGDGFKDGEERLVYGMNPVTGNDADGDHLSDYDELYRYFPVDTIDVAGYMNSSIDLVSEWPEDDWYGVANHNITLPTKITMPGKYHIYTEPTGANVRIGANSKAEAAVDDPLEINLNFGMYNITFNSTGLSSNPITHLVIAKQGCNLTTWDTDGDGIPDGDETGSPLDRDSDNDGLPDNEEQVPLYMETWKGTTYYGTFELSSPVNRDTDHDGISDRFDAVRNNFEYLEFNNYLYPPHSITEDKTFRGWGLGGNSRIVHSYGTDYRGTEDVKVSDMDNLNVIKTNILRMVPSWYDVENSSLQMGGNALYSPQYNLSGWEDPTGYPEYYINYSYLANYYNATLYNKVPVYRYETGQIGDGSQSDNSAWLGIPYFNYGLLDIGVEVDKTQFIIMKYSLPSYEDDHYFNNQSSYKLPAFEYKFYLNSNGSINFESNPMHSSLLVSEGYVVPVEVEGTGFESTYSLKFAIPAEMAKQSKMHLHLSPVYITKDGPEARDKSIIPWNLYGLTIGSIEKSVPDHSYKVISKLSKNISALDAALPANMRTLSTGNHPIGGINTYVYNGMPSGFVFSSSMLSGDAIAVISTTEGDVDEIVSHINFTTLWYYNISNTYDENMTMKEFKSISHSSSGHYIYNTFGCLGYNVSSVEYYSVYLDKNFTGITKHNGTAFSYSVTTSNALFDGRNHIKSSHALRNQVNSLNEIGALSDSKFGEIKTIFPGKAQGSMISMDDSFIMVMVPNKKLDGTISMETFSLLSDIWGMRGNLYSTFKTTKDLVELKKITDPIKQAAKVKDFMTPDVGPLEYIDLAFSAIDLGMTWYNAYNSNDKFVTKAAGEHTAAIAINVGISVAGIAFPPAGVVTAAWTATYYAMYGGMSLLGIETGPYMTYAKDPGTAIVFSFVAFTGISIPSAFVEEAFTGAEGDILRIYMDHTHYINSKWFVDDESGVSYYIAPYYPQFYIDPR
jgi:hypothetical protein